MHIGIFTDTYYPTINGVSASTLYFTNEFIKRGHHVSIFCPKVPGYNNEVNDHRKPGCSFYRCFSFRYPPNPEHYFAQSWLGFNVIIRKVNLDIIHIQDPGPIGIYGAAYAKKLKIPLTQTYHTDWEHYGHHFFLPAPLMKVVVKTWIRLLSNICNTNFAPTSEIKNLLLNYGVTSPIVICPTGIDIEGSQKTINKRLFDTNLGIDRKKKILLFASRMCKEKSVDIVIKAFPRILKEIPESVLILSGDGPQKREIKKAIKKMNIDGRIILKGYLTRPDLYAHYKAADLFIFPSISETQGLVVIEAQMFGLPVVGVAKNGVKMIIKQNKGGLLANTRDPEEIARLCIKMLKEKELYKNKKIEAIENAQKWKISGFADIMEKYFNELSDNNKKAPKYRKIYSVPISMLLHPKL